MPNKLDNKWDNSIELLKYRLLRLNFEHILIELNYDIDYEFSTDAEYRIEKLDNKEINVFLRIEDHFSPEAGFSCVFEYSVVMMMKRKIPEKSMKSALEAILEPVFKNHSFMLAQITASTFRDPMYNPPNVDSLKAMEKDN